MIDRNQGKKNFKVTALNQGELKCHKDFFRAWVREDAYLISKSGYSDILIRHLEVGDEILGRCEKTGEIGYRKVKSIFSAENAPTYLLYYQSTEERNSVISTMETTANANFLVSGRGWVSLMNLRTGDEVESLDYSVFSELFKANGKLTAVENKKNVVFAVKATGMLRTMYSLELEDCYSYSVSGHNLWLRDAIVVENFVSNAKTEFVSEGLRICGCCSMGGQQYVLDENRYPCEIDFVYPNMAIMSRSDKTGEYTVSQVCYLLQHQRIEICDIYYTHNGDKKCAGMSCAQELLVKGRGWVRATDLFPGDVFESGTGNVTVVDHVQTEWGGEADDSSFISFVLDGDNNYCLGWDGELCARGFKSDT